MTEFTWNIYNCLWIKNLEDQYLDKKRKIRIANYTAILLMELS